MESIDQSCAPDLRQSILSSSSPTENSSPKKRFFTTQEDFNMTGASLDPNLPNRKKTQAEVIFNVSGTKYPVVRSVGKDIFNWTLSTDSQKEWDVAWIDYISDYSIFSKIKPFQKVSFFPGIKCLARKDQLGLNLMRLKRKFPTAYDFFPETYVLPGDYEEFRAEINKGKQQTVYIVKPQASCQGKGIFLTNTISNIDRGIDYVAQKYLTRPYLIDGLKFDMRIYVFLSSCDPLRIYLYEDGLARFATEPYKSPNLDNLNDVFMHLTNYAINKNSPNFVFNNSSANNDVGHKRSIKSLFKILKEQGHDVTRLWNEIKKIIIKTFCCGQSTLAHTYKSYMSKNSANNCFQIFGIDIMLDEDLKPWLLELNQSPSWTTDTPFDKMIKENVIRDALKILNISAKDRTNYKKKLREEIEARSLHGKPPRPTEEQIKAEFNRKQEELDQWEASNGTGGYEKIYPIKTSSEDVGPDENYAEFLAAGKDTSPFKDISLYRFPLTNPDSMASPQFSPKTGKSPQMAFGGSYKSQQKHFSPLRKRKSENKANSKQNFYSRGTLPDQKDQEGDMMVEDIGEEKRPTTQKNAKTKNGQGRKSSNGRKNKQAGKKMFNSQKPTLQLGDFDDLLDDNVNPTSTGTSNKSVERKEELVEKSASKNKNCPHPSAFPRQLAASIFERLAAGKKQYAKIALHIPSDPSNAVRMDISNTHKMTLEKKLEEQRSGFIPKRFTQNLSNREMGKNLASTQNLKAENASVIVETTTEPDVRDMMSPSTTPQNKKFIQGREKHNSDKVTFGRESINRPSQTQFGNFLMPKRFENAYTGSKSRVMFSTSYEKNSWVRGSSADPESPIPLGSFLKAAVNVKNKP